MKKIVLIVISIFLLSSPVLALGLHDLLRAVASMRNKDSVETPIFEFDVVSTQTIAGEFSTTEEITVDWGDGGAAEKFNGENRPYSKDYGSPGNRTIKIYAPSGESALTKFNMTQSGFLLSGLPSGLTYFYCSGSNTVLGNLSDIPSDSGVQLRAIGAK